MKKVLLILITSLSLITICSQVAFGAFNEGEVYSIRLSDSSYRRVIAFDGMMLICPYAGLRPGEVYPDQKPVSYKWKYYASGYDDDGNYYDAFWRVIGVTGDDDIIGKRVLNSWYHDPSDGKWYYLDKEGKLVTNGTTPDGHTVNESGAWYVGNIVQVSDIGVTSGKTLYTDADIYVKTNKKASDTSAATSYAYLAGTEFRGIQREYPTARGNGAYVQPYNDTNGNSCVLVVVSYTIIRQYTEVVMYNMTTGERIEDPGNYYSRKAKDYAGENAIRYLDLSTDALRAQEKALQGLINGLGNGQNSGSGEYVPANALNL